MAGVIVVHKGRTNKLPFSLGVDVSLDTITSEIRTLSGELIAEWAVAFDGDGTDGELILTLDDSVTSAITYASGIMDLKRMIGIEPFAVFDEPLEVEFRETVTE